MMQIVPFQLVAIGFDPEAMFEGKIMDELAKLKRQQTIRILDLLLCTRTPRPGTSLPSTTRGRS